MFLTEPRLQAWIAQLKTQPETRITPEDNDPWDPMPANVSWGITLYASAYFGIDSDAKDARLRQAIPASFRAFDALTEQRITHYHDARVYPRDKAQKPSRDNSAIVGLEDRYASNKDMTSLNSFSGDLKQASPDFKFRTLVDLHPGRRIGTPLEMLDYLSVSIPLSFFNTHRSAFMHWWQQTLTDLAPAQAYMGLCIGMPSNLESMGAIEPADYALAQSFYGYDIDKPFFMCSNEHDGLHLDDGMRTPTFGVLVRGAYLEKLGGESALLRQLQHPEIRVSHFAEGLWIEAGNAPQLYPVEGGIPSAMAQVAQVLKPVRLERMKLTGMLEVVPRTDVFTIESATTWLQRFDGWTPSNAATTPTPMAHPSQPCPKAGLWFAPLLQNKTVRMQLGEPMPAQTMAPSGAVIWYYKGP
jgi:hypothetical protein